MMKTIRLAQGKKAFVVTGLGYGDEGKGTVTHWLSSRHRAHTVIRTGGPQALHHVVTKDGASQVFSQFGSGTLRGSATHLSKNMVIDPHAILAEGEVLKYESGIRGVFDTMTIHEDALVITPLQAIAGRVRELLRGKNRLGSVGIGVGETILDSEILGDAAVRAKDLSKPYLREKLEAIQRRKWAEFEELADRANDIDSDVRDRVRLQLADMEDQDTIQWAIERFGDLVRRVRIVDTEYVAKRILGPEGTVVFEGSQGVLLDRFHGFHPYTTKVRATPETAKEILRETGYDGEVQSLGILRAYHTRHGAGPFVSESAELTAQLPDETNKEHPWQGKFRVGHFDLIAARYALDACGKGAIDGLVITCVDRVLKRGTWDMCTAYVSKDSFGEDVLKELSVHNEEDASVQLKMQATIGRLLGRCTPLLSTYNFSQKQPAGKHIKTLASVLGDSLGIPIAVVSVGETEVDKIEIENGQ